MAAVLPVEGHTRIVFRILRGFLWLLFSALTATTYMCLVVGKRWGRKEVGFFRRDVVDLVAKNNLFSRGPRRGTPAERSQSQTLSVSCNNVLLVTDVSHL